MGPAVVLCLLAVHHPVQTSPESLLTAAVPRGGRSMLRIDPVEHAQVVGGPDSSTFHPSFAGLTWTHQLVGADGWFTGSAFSSGYAAWEYHSEREKTVLIEGQGHTMVYVNGEPRTGDPYQFGYVSLPARIRKGKNLLLFACSRGRFRVSLVEGAAPVSFDLRDATLPDIVQESEESVLAGIVLKNAQASALPPGSVTATAADGTSIRTQVAAIPPFSIRKIKVALPQKLGEIEVRYGDGANGAAKTKLSLRRREPGQARMVTFLSGIDGSVQYYGLQPSRSKAAGQALVLTLHGASVEAIGQAEAYSAKSWAHIVAPTNRRPFGFDWEDIGRKDALEVLAIAQASLKTDASRTYVTGHSMGGHGAWMFGAQFPGRFAATAPCAGWQSFWTYAGGPPRNAEGEIAKTLLRASNQSDPLMIGQNYLHTSIYILHGDADDTVPVREPRTMREELSRLGARVSWHEEPGQGHWYDTDPEPGANCVDWPPIFDLFAQTRIPAAQEVTHLKFATVSPAIHSTTFWATISQQASPLLPSEVDLLARPLRREIAGTTKNVAHLELRPDALAGSGMWSATLDGKTFADLPEGAQFFVKAGAEWQLGSPLRSAVRSPSRGAGIKEVFDRNVVLVYGTAGTPEQDRWALARARFDAENFWYRGNSGCLVVPDSAFEAAAYPGRNVVLYGDQRMNSAFPSVVGKTEIRIDQGSLLVGDQEFKERDTGFAFVAPRIGSDTETVLVIGGLGEVGLRTTDRLPLFVSGAGLPDYVVLSARASSEGEKGVLAAGFLSNDGSIEKTSAPRR
ncbi:MAG: prolyl oligopeptidase family serine peptidase [Fimbriimonadaceae bacterium]